MNCPVDKTPLEQAGRTFACSQCNGAWIKAEVLVPMLEERASTLVELEWQPSAEDHHRGCPECGEAMQTVKPSGTVVVLGWCTVPDSYVPALYLMKEIRLQFSMTYDVAEFRHVIDALEHDAAPLRALVSSVVSLDELPETFESLRGGSAECKVIIDPRAQ